MIFLFVIWPFSTPSTGKRREYLSLPLYIQLLQFINHFFCFIFVLFQQYLSVLKCDPYTLQHFIHAHNNPYFAQIFCISVFPLFNPYHYNTLFYFFFFIQKGRIYLPLIKRFLTFSTLSTLHMETF